MAGRLIHYGIGDLDAAAIRLSAPRRFTQEISNHIYTLSAADGAPMVRRDRERGKGRRTIPRSTRMAHSFDELRSRMAPERRGRNAAEAARVLPDMTLHRGVKGGAAKRSKTRRRARRRGTAS
jgi:hypothetical protein